MYELQLNYPVGSFDDEGYEEAEVLKSKLKSKSDFRGKLLFYNEHIRSLSTCETEDDVYNNWEYFEDLSSADLLENEKVFLAVRKDEVKRMVEQITKLDSYSKKLNFIFSIKGYEPNKVPKISDIPLDENGNAIKDTSNIHWWYYKHEPKCDKDPNSQTDKEQPWHRKQGPVCDMYPKFSRDNWQYIQVIDLHPKTTEEYKIYNDFVVKHFEQRYLDGSTGFKGAYNGFDFEKEKQRMDETLKKADDKELLLSDIRAQLKGFIYPSELKNINRFQRIEESNSSVKEFLIKMRTGCSIALIRQRLIVDEEVLLEYTHAKELYKFYKYFQNIDLDANNIKGGDAKNEHVKGLFFIVEERQVEFKSIEAKALGKDYNIKDSAIRCAAFCEMLYNEGFIEKTRYWITRLTAFGRERYKMKINTQLQSGTGDKFLIARKRHRNETQENGLKPLIELINKAHT